MATLAAIIEDNYKWVTDSGYTVDVDRPHSWVSIAEFSNDDSSVFLQGDEAESFIAEADSLWDSVGTVSYFEVYAHLAKPFIESLI